MTEPADAGLQAERTGLSWIRTSLGIAANGALLLRLGLQDREPFLQGAGWFLLVFAVVAYAVGDARRSTVSARVRRGETPTAPWLLTGVAATTILLAVVVLVAVAT